MPLTAASRLARRWIPPNSQPVPHPQRGESAAIVYLYESRNQRTGATNQAAIAYIGTAAKPAWNFVFPQPEQRERRISSLFASLDERERLKAAHRADTNRPHTLQVGDVLTNSWGYDQTNVDWYRVSKTAPHSVWLQPIAQQLVSDPGNINSMAGRCVPQTNPDGSFVDLKGSPELHRASAYGQNGESRVCFEYGSGRKWDGKPEYVSWYA